jgi:hypothetical protein
MDTPLLERLTAQFFNQLRFSIPHLPHFMMTTEKLGFDHAKFLFHRGAVCLFGYTGVRRWNNFNIDVSCRHLDWQVTSVAQISNAFSEVVDLTLDYRVHMLSS